MNQPYTTLDKNQLEKSLSELKRNAREYTDVINWIENNPLAFGIIPPPSKDDLTIIFSFSVTDALKTDDLENPIIKGFLEIQADNNSERHPLIDSGFMANGDASSTQKMHTGINLSFNEWPMLTSILALHTLQDILEVTDEQYKRVQPLLSKYIPYHFPGLSWKGLKAVSDADLLLINNNGIIDKDAFCEMLFSTRTGSPIINLSNQLEI